MTQRAVFFLRHFGALTLFISCAACSPQEIPGTNQPSQAIQANDLVGRWELHNVLVKSDSSGSKTGISIQMMDDAGKPVADREQILLVEAGIRDGKLTGCQITEKGKVLESSCSLKSDGQLILEIGETQAKMAFELHKGADGRIVGESFVKSAMIPLGRVKIGDASLTRPAPATPVPGASASR